MKKQRMPSYGGQALIEGVLMRGSKAVAAAMRAPDGSISIHTEKLTGIYQSSIRNIPFLRGLVILWDSVGLGTRFLTLSSNMQTGENEKIEGPAMYLSIGIALVFAIGIFVLFPSAFSQWIEQALKLNFWFANLIEAFLRLVLAIGYIWAIGKLPDIQRVFQYHGAEHKTINAYEAGVELTPENVAQYPLEHPRCGTGFLLTVIIFTILLFTPLRLLPFLIRLPLQILLVPAIACLAYEYMRWTASHLDIKFVQTLIAPNLALQKLTTRIPTHEMIEVAIAAFNAMAAFETELAAIPVSIDSQNTGNLLKSSIQTPDSSNLNGV